MHETHIFDPKKMQKYFSRPTYSIYFRQLQEINNLFFLGLTSRSLLAKTMLLVVRYHKMLKWFWAAAGMNGLYMQNDM